MAISTNENPALISGAAKPQKKAKTKIVKMLTQTFVNGQLVEVGKMYQLSNKDANFFLMRKMAVELSEAEALEQAEREIAEAEANVKSGTTATVKKKSKSKT